MTGLDLRGFDLNPTKVTFESIRPIEPPDGSIIPAIKVGYKGKMRVMLYQYLDEVHSKEGMKTGEWFALCPDLDVNPFRTAINKCEPASRPLDELKKFVESTILQHFGA
jgi:hypothetical protein